MTLVALLSDFGLTDPYVGVLKAVLLARAPGVSIVDLTHDIAPGDVRAGAFWLDRTLPYLPAGAVICAVVDPGVGTARRALVARAGGRILLGPDNGLLVRSLARDGTATVHAIDPARAGLPPPSRTFHGRDLFAPLAADLAGGHATPESLGDTAHALWPDPLPAPRAEGGALLGEVVAVDRFGNCLTNLEGQSIGPGAIVEVGGRRLPLAGTYGDVAPGAALALVGSFGTLELAIRDGSASERLGLRAGEPVRVIPGGGSP